MSIRILKPGLLATVQDMGRTGLGQFGIAASGAMDTIALRTANWLVGNGASAAALEITMAGFSAEFLEDTWIALTGGDMSPEIGGKRVPMWRPVRVRQGSRLALRRPVCGCRIYLAVAGGIEVPVVMGSRSTYLRAGIGGFGGRALRAGDELQVGAGPGTGKGNDTGTSAEIGKGTAAGTGTHSDSGMKPDTGAWGIQGRYGNAGIHGTQGMVTGRANVWPGPDDPCQTGLNASFQPARWGISASALPVYSRNPVIRIVRGRQWDDFAAESRSRFLESSFTVTLKSDRMGYRLSGPDLKLSVPREYVSEGVAHGTVQVPADGQPIVLMADRQTLGGYPKIAQVVSADLPVMAQLAPGDKLVFRETGLREAEVLLTLQERGLKLLERMIRRKWEENRHV